MSTEAGAQQRVLFILPDLSGGGAERVTLNVMRGLDRQRYKPALFLIKNQGVYWDEVPPDVEVINSLKSGNRVRWNLFKLIRQLYCAVRRDDIVIGAVEYDSIFLAALASKIKGCIAIGWFRINVGFWIANLSVVRKLLCYWLFPELSVVITVSHGVARSVLNAYPKLQSRVQVLYNPLDIEFIRQRSELPAAVSTNLERIPLIVGVGRLEYQKNFEILIRAHVELLARGVKQELLILGEGSERSRLESLICELAVKDTARLVGFQTNPFAIIRQAAVFVLSSRHEGMPGALLQAMALGVPVVAADCPSGPAELLDKDRYGLLVPADDLDAMVEAIASILGDPSLAAQLSKLGRERAEQFRPEVIIPAFESLLLGISQQK